MECFSRYLWPRLWRFKFLLFLNLVLLLNANKLSSEVPRLSTTITTLAAASFSGDGTASLVIITQCSNLVEEAAPRSMHGTACWRSSDNSFGVQITKEDSSVLPVEDVLCGIFLCWGNRSSSSSQMAPSMTATGISFTAIATDHNDSHCGMEEGNFSAIFCWGKQFGDGKFLPSVALPGFCSMATASGMLQPWQREGSADIATSSSLGEPGLPSSTHKRSSLSTAAPMPPLLPPLAAHPRKSKILIRIGIWASAVFACLFFFAAGMYLAWLYCFKKVPSMDEYEPAVDFEYTDEEEGAAGAQEQTGQEDESEGEDIEVFLAQRAAQRRAEAQALAAAEAAAQLTAAGHLGGGQAAVNQAVACADAQK